MPAIAEMIRTGQVKVDLVGAGQPGNWQITISNGSGIRHTEITANSARSAWAWGDGWAQGLRTAGNGDWQVKDVEAL